MTVYTLSANNCPQQDYFSLWPLESSSYNDLQKKMQFSKIYQIGVQLEHAYRVSNSFRANRESCLHSSNGNFILPNKKKVALILRYIS